MNLTFFTTGYVIDYGGDFGITPIDLVVDIGNAPSADLVFDIQVNDVPEPASYALLGVGLLAVGAIRYRHKIG